MPKKRAAKDQSKLFIEKAREIGCDDGADETEIMRRLAGQKRREFDRESNAKKPPLDAKSKRKP